MIFKSVYKRIKKLGFILYKDIEFQWYFEDIFKNIKI